MKWIGKTMCVAGLMVLVACGNDAAEKEKEPQKEETVEMVEVEIPMKDEAPLNEEVDLKAEVTYKGETVADADEVRFEVWKQDKKDDAVFYDGKLEGDGLYHAKHTFEEDGIYIVQAHVTAKDMHVMPKESIFVGDVSEEEKAAFEEDEDEKDDEHGGH
ncbi:FixH family protein [Shouchella lonarensis]|uniref:YtkA-like n=1 Tax=Shouchella lonarensis TaxID=1464122 RepID=A0A1G6PDI0_9BACI|nr:FixH family protein [Shouchella lonarensis]SDC77624.1 YtkA-like [Shouchella lonarensis]